MIISQMFGMIRFVLDVVYPAPPCGESDNRPSVVRDVNGYDYTTMQIGVAFLAIIVISLLTEPIPSAKVR